MIYTAGTIAANGNTVTGTGTNFTQAGSLIRVGCTIITMSSPIQVFQITSINSATQLTVTPAASPALTAGTRYSILLSDSLSVDGLAQSIAETFTMYQRYMSGFSDVMNSSGDVTITINGSQVTVPGQKSLAKKGANNDITSLAALKTPLYVSQGGTGASNATDARTALGLGVNNIVYFKSYACKQGVNGGFSSSTFNFFWNSLAQLEAWVDSSFVGSVNLNTSDKNIKESIDYVSEFDGDLSVVLNLKPATFKFSKRGVIELSETRRGFIAQDVRESAPLAVLGKEDTDFKNIDEIKSMLSLDPLALCSHLVGAIKAQQVQIDDLKAEVQKLRAEKSNL